MTKYYFKLFWVSLLLFLLFHSHNAIFVACSKDNDSYDEQSIKTVITTTTTTKESSLTTRRWSDINTWSNKKLPGQGDTVVILTHVLFDINQSPLLKSITINGTNGRLECGDGHIKVGSILITNNASLVIDTISSSQNNNNNINNRATFSLEVRKGDTTGMIIVDNGGSLVIKGGERVINAGEVGILSKIQPKIEKSINITIDESIQVSQGGSLYLFNTFIVPTSCKVIIEAKQGCKDLNILYNIIQCNINHYNNINNNNNNNINNNNNNETTLTISIIELNNVSSSTIHGNNIHFNQSPTTTTTTSRVTFITMLGGYNNTISSNIVQSTNSTTVTTFIIGYNLLLNNNNYDNELRFNNNTSIRNNIGVLVDYLSSKDDQGKDRNIDYLESKTSITFRGLRCLSNKGYGVLSRIRNLSVLDSTFYKNGVGVSTKGDPLTRNHLSSPTSPSIIQTVTNSIFIGGLNQSFSSTYSPIAIELIDGTLLINNCTFRYFKFPITFVDNDFVKIIYLKSIRYHYIVQSVMFNNPPINNNDSTTPNMNGIFTEYVKDLDGSTTSNILSTESITDKKELLQNIQSQRDCTTIVRNIDFFRSLPICQEIKWWKGVLFCDNSFSSFIHANILIHQHYPSTLISTINNNNLRLSLSMGGDKNNDYIVDLGRGLDLMSKGDYSNSSGTNWKLFNIIIPSGLALQIYPNQLFIKDLDVGINNSIIIIKIQQIYWEKGDYIHLQLPINQFSNHNQLGAIYKFNYPNLTTTAIATPSSTLSTSTKTITSKKIKIHPPDQLVVNYYQLEETPYASQLPDQQFSLINNHYYYLDDSDLFFQTSQETNYPPDSNINTIQFENLFIILTPKK